MSLVCLGHYQGHIDWAFELEVELSGWLTMDLEGGPGRRIGDRESELGPCAGLWGGAEPE